MISIIQAIIAAMTGSPTFIYGDAGWNNFKGDNTASFPVVFLNEPLMSNDTLHQGGYYEEEYPLQMLFLKKSKLSWTPEEHHVVIDAMRTLRREFVNRLQDNAAVNTLTGFSTTDVINVMDLNLSGVLIEFNCKLFNTESNCTS